MAATAITSCGRDSRFREELISLDSVLAAKPDSVYNVLADMRDEAMKQSVSDRMYYELMLADAQNKAYIDFTTDSVMKSVAELLASGKRLEDVISITDCAERSGAVGLTVSIAMRLEDATSSQRMCLVLSKVQ